MWNLYSQIFLWMITDFCFYCSYLLFQMLFLLNSPSVHLKGARFITFIIANVLSATFFSRISEFLRPHTKKHGNTGTYMNIPLIMAFILVNIYSCPSRSYVQDFEWIIGQYINRTYHATIRRFTPPLPTAHVPEYDTKFQRNRMPESII